MSEDEKHEFPHWEELYQRQEIEFVPWFNPELDEDLEKALDELGLRNGRSLDLGTGPGAQAMRLARRGFDVTATDISEAAILLAREKARRQGLEIASTRGLNPNAIAIPRRANTNSLQKSGDCVSRRGVATP